MKAKILLTFGLICLFALILSIACNKKSTSLPTPADTVTVIKNDTTTLIDTVYGTKPDPLVKLNQGLLLYLNFTGNIADSSGNNNPTTANGSVLTTDEFGYSGDAFGSSGNGNEVLVTNNGSIQFDTAWTLSFDFMVLANGQMCYVSMADPATGHGPSFIVGTIFSAVPSVVLGIGDITGNCNSTGLINSANLADTINFTPSLGSWYNFIAIYHKGSLQVYVDGSLLSTDIGTGTAALDCPASQIMIGSWWNGQQLSLNGKMDNVRFYNRVMNAHEITALASYYQTATNGQKRLVQRRNVITPN